MGISHKNESILFMNVHFRVKMEDIHNYKRQLEREIILLEKDSISPENKEQLIKFKDYLSSEGLGAARIKKYIGQARKYCKMLKSPVENADESDIRRIMGQIEQTELSPETKRDFKIFLRKFYQFLRGCGPDDEMPPEVKWLKLTIPKSKKKQPDELIREVETKGMIMSGISNRDRAFVCLLAETGARISEIGTIKLKNVSFEKYGVRIRVIGKTGPRPILVVEIKSLEPFPLSDVFRKYRIIRGEPSPSTVLKGNKC